TLHFGAFMTPSRQDAKPYRILIVCPNGVGTGNMIKSEVLSLVPQATEVINIPLGKYRPDHGYDVVISTVTLPEEKNQIVVHPILTDQDRVAVLRRCMVGQPQARMEIEEIIKIAAKYIPDERLEAFKKELADRYSGLNIYRAQKKNYGQGLMDYLQPSHIQIINRKTDWQEALEISCRPLLEAGSITERYLEAMIRDQKEKGLYMFLTEGLVLAHSSSENGVNHVDVSLTTFTPAVRFLNQKEARIIITLCAEDQTKHIRILNDIIKIFSKKKKNIGQLADLDQIQDVYAMIAEKTEEGE
ncbi:MAG: PTS sugar transporter subunit IIA, partial [Erysipelotrichaceae bacterium]|nr:PTS sugar transporter subunit IIA [Erysipelotrichaceae bacterium]